MNEAEVAALAGAPEAPPSPPPAPEPEAPATAEPAASATPEAPPVIDYAERDRQLTTALGALRDKQRQERQQHQNELAEIKQQFEAMRKQVSSPATPKADDDPMPDPKVDAMAYVEWSHREAQRSRDRQERQQKAEEQANAQTAQQRQVIHQYHQAAQEFKETEPAFEEAYHYIREHRAKELQAFGLRDPVRLEAALQQEEFQLALGAMQNGINPAEALFQAANLRGFKSTGGEVAPAPLSAAVTHAGRDPATGQFVAAAPAPPSTQPTRKAPGSLSTLPGAPGGQQTPAALAEMDTKDMRDWGGSDFAGTWKKFWKG